MSIETVQAVLPWNRKLPMRVLLILGALFSLGSLHELQAQDKTVAFKELELGLSVQNNINRNYFHQFWSADPMLQINSGTPFYAGIITLSASYGQFESREEELPDIDNFQITLGWGERIPLTTRLRLGGGVGILASVFSFKNVSEEIRLRTQNTFGSTSPESEIGLAISADLSYSLSTKWDLRLSWNRSVVYTHTKLKMHYVGIGIVRSFQMPVWLTRALR